MTTVVVTGSTRGIGYGLAREFLARGCAVMVSGRGQAAVDKAMSELSEKHGAERVKGFACDVTDAAVWSFPEFRLAADALKAVK